MLGGMGEFDTAFRSVSVARTLHLEKFSTVLVSVVFPFKIMPKISMFLAFKASTVKNI